MKQTSLPSENIISTINSRLHQLAENEYKVFNAKIITTGYPLLGVRMPALRALAKEVAASDELAHYLQQSEFTSYEHILLYGLVLGQAKKMPLESMFSFLDPLILKYDNWAHVDTVLPLKPLNKHCDEALQHFLPLKTHEGEFTKRFFVIFLMSHLMSDEYIDVALLHLREVPQGQYYVDMAIAWMISVGVVKYPEKAIPLIEQEVFSKFVHNKAIQKSRESFRVSVETKVYLKSLKRG